MNRSPTMLKPRVDHGNPRVGGVENPDHHIRFSVTQAIITLALEHGAKRLEFPAAHIVAGDVFDGEANQPSDKAVVSRIVDAEPIWQRGNSRRISVEKLFEAASSFRRAILFRAKSRYRLNCRMRGLQSEKGIGGLAGADGRGLYHCRKESRRGVLA